MTVYVDDATIPATVPNGPVSHTSTWSHLTADTQDELHAFAARLGLRRSYFQDKPRGLWHYDVTKGKREQALRLGAVPMPYGTEAFDLIWHKPDREGWDGPAPEQTPEQDPPTSVVTVSDEHDVYIGRPSRWGNPFVIDKDGDRDQVIAKYRAWIAGQPDLLADLPSLRGKRLACHCAPRSCHGDVLAGLADAAAPPDNRSTASADISAPISAQTSTAAADTRRPVGWIDGFPPGKPEFVLSNFGPGSCTVDGVDYPSGEHGFTAAKSLDPTIRAHILMAATPREAKRLGSRNGIVDLRPDWDTRVRYEVMGQVISSKFAHGTEAAEFLLGTGDEVLVETNTWHDTHWGHCTCEQHRAWPGRNELGLALMRQRELLRSASQDAASGERWVRVMCTGHRDQHMTPEQRTWVDEELARVAAKLVAERGMRVAIHGGANGADLAWAKAADRAGVDSLWAYLPYPNQIRGWSEQQRADWAYCTSPRSAGGAATKRWTLGDAFDVRLLHARNDAMIRDAQAVVAVHDPEKTTGGTASALKKIDGSLPIITLDIRNRTVKIRRSLRMPGSTST